MMFVTLNYSKLTYNNACSIFRFQNMIPMENQNNIADVSMKLCEYYKKYYYNASKGRGRCYHFGTIM